MENEYLNYILIGILIIISAFFSATETAFSTVNKIRLKHSANNGNKKALNAVYVVENFDKALSTVLIGNNIVNIAASSIATMVFLDLFGDSGAVIATLVMTVLVLLFGEILPKSLASENSENFALKVAGIVKTMMLLFSPVVFLFLKLKQGILKITKSSNSSPSVTEQELKYIVERIEEEGVLEEQESELVQQALDFDERILAEILTPRVDMSSINIEAPLEQIKQKVLENRFSRIPVYRGNIDNIIGILHSRDLLEKMVKNEEIILEDIVFPPYFVYRTKKVSALLADFQKRHLHIAIVTDDYGGTLGLVTMEDLLEQLVGEIWDEDEEINQPFSELEKGIYQASGDILISDLFEILGKKVPPLENRYISLGGWLFENYDRMPQIGENFIYENLKFTVTATQENRVTKLKIEEQ